MRGLTQQEVALAQNKFGFNEIVREDDAHLVLKLLWHQVNNLLIYVLLIAALITYFLDHAIDTYVILAVIFLNTLIGFIQEYKASKAIAALQDLVVAQAKVYRDGQITMVPSRELVVGDIVVVEAGDRVPADGMLLEAKSLRAVESSLTGEAFPVDKQVGALSSATALADRSDKVWMSTFIAAGTGLFEVTAIGGQTAIGKIAQNLKEIKREKTHFELKTDLLAKQMSVIAVVVTVFTFVIGYFWRGFGFMEIFTFSVASLVSSVPEGLPAVIAIILATGASRMARKKAIVRSLPSTETLSVVDVIATDKTGTLTQNTMTVRELFVAANKQHIAVTGEGWQPMGDFLFDGKKMTADALLQELALLAGVCSQARLVAQKEQDKTSYSITGDPTDGALLVLAHKAGLAEQVQSIKVIDTLPFDQEQKLKAVLLEHQDACLIVVSGAAESILARSSLSASERTALLEQVHALSAQAMRVIALAKRSVSSSVQELGMDDVTDLSFVGLVGMIDPPRQGAREAVLQAQQAGIRIIMKTGDHQATALAIARQVGILGEDTDDAQSVMTGAALEQLSQDEFEQAVQRVSVFARLTPDMKLRILTTIQKQGHTVAMTGDGVNDVLALKKADLGIAMGKIGTDAAREASDIVLADDNFSSLVAAIVEGRIIFANTRQASAFLLTTNFTEDLIILLSVFLGSPLPLIASQILWLNLVTDGLTDMALAAEPGHGDILAQKPKRKGEGILTRTMLSLMVPIILVMTASCLWIFFAFLPEGLDKARTAAFCAMCFTQLLNIFTMRSLDLSIWQIGWWSNKYVLAAVLFSLFLQYLAMSQPWLMEAFRFVPLRAEEVGAIFCLSLAVLLVGEVHKLWRKTSAHSSARN